MAKIIIYAKACEFEQSAGYRSLTYMPFDPDLARQTVEYRNCGEIDDALLRLKDQVAKASASSFFVSALLPRGERAPSGFRKRRFKIEVDRCAGAAAS